MAAISGDALERARRVRLMVFDVDGVMTDGRLWYGPEGETLKQFYSHDGHGLKLLAASGVASAILSGRRSSAVEQRAAELGIAHVLQGIEDKRAAWEALIARLGLPAERNRREREYARQGQRAAEDERPPSQPPCVCRLRPAQGGPQLGGKHFHPERLLQEPDGAVADQAAHRLVFGVPRHQDHLHARPALV